MKRVQALLLVVFLAAAACKGDQGAAPRATSLPPAPDTSVTAPGPTSSSTSAPASAKPMSHPFGLKWNWDQLDALRPYLSRNAGGATFYLVTWCDIEPRRGDRDWSDVDRVVKGARELGYDMYLKIRVGSCWATGGAAGPGVGNRRLTASLMPTDMAAYRQFVDSAVRRYSPQGVRTWGIENEVNARNFWQGTPDEYRRLAAAVAATIRGADPKARVLDSGLSSIAYGALLARELLDGEQEQAALAQYQRYYERRFDNPRFVYPRASTIDELRDALDSEVARRGRAFMDATIELDRAKVTDAFQLHYYDPVGELPAVLALIRGRLRPQVPIEAWEAGVAWPGPDYDGRVHAAETVMLLGQMLIGDVRRTIYLPAAFTPGGARENELVRGLVEPDGRLRPAGTAYSLLIDAAAANRGWRVVAGSGLTGIAFDKGASTALVLWSDKGATLPSLPGAQGKSLAGQATDVKGGAKVGREPVYLTVAATLDGTIAAFRPAS